jgi:hypothetical protein
MNSLNWWMSAGVCTLTMAWSTAAHAQVTGPINVTALPLPHASCPGAVNAIPNDGASDNSAFACALNLLPASGGEIYVPAGKFNLGITLSVLNKPVAFRGEGQRITTILWDAVGASGNGIDFVSNSGPINHTLTVKSMSLLRKAGSGGAAIGGSWQTPTDYRTFGGTSATIFDVHISNENYGPEAGTPIHWLYGIRLTNAVGARIHVFNIHGWVGLASAGILIDGKSIGVSINDGDLGRAIRGIWVSGSSESVRVENVETSENTWGYLFDTTGKYHVISNTHAGAIYGHAVAFYNNSDGTITDNLFYGLGGTIGIYIENPGVAGTGFEIRGNQVSFFQDGITLNGAISDSRVTNNTISVTRYAVHLLGTVTTSAIITNDRAGATILDASACVCNLQANNP